MTKEVAVKQTAVAQFNFFDNNQFATMQRVCSMFAASELVPKMYQISESGKEKAIANCMIAVETAQRIGASPLMVMQNMYIVHGQPAWSAKFLTATVNGCGRYDSIKYKWDNLGKVKFGGVDIDNWSCIAYTSEKGSDDVLESIPVTIDMAIKEGWYGKKGSKWQTMPKLMLQYRSVTFWTRAYAPELSMGIRTEDEVKDIIDVSYEEVNDKSNANSKEMKIPEDKKEGDTPKAEDKPGSGQKLDTLEVPSLEKAKEILINDFGASAENLPDEAAIREAAAGHGIEIVIKKGPNF